MKYIKTKDGIFDNRLMDGVIPERISAQTFGIEAIKYSDSIEELCDEFVVENPEKDIHERCCDLQDVFDWVGDLEIPIGIKHFDEERGLISGEHDWNVYAAIWTEYGLKYVAKMNKKGELELL